MSVSIANQDIIWTRLGDPVRVQSVDQSTGMVTVDPNFKKVQDVVKLGLKNGLMPETRDAFKQILTESMSSDKKQEIRNLYEKVNELKASKADPRLIRYLDNELKFRIVQNNFKPENYGENPINFNT